MSKNTTSSFILHPSSFLPDLKKLVVELAEDLLTRSTLPEIDRGLREAYTQIEKGGRTADPFEVWREDYLDQVAVAWVLGCVFVRFMEDNHLIDECWLAGEGERRTLAESNHELFFREHPHDSDREYLEHVFHEVGNIPACRDLFAPGKTALWAVGPSGDAAMKLLGFWREIDPESGRLKRSFAAEKDEGGRMKDELSSPTHPSSFTLQPSEPTRFLGDLYQDLSERARKKYALLQTPVFVEEFILDRTLDPAIDEFGLDEVRMIDPTCGSGHFLLGGFARLFDLWIKLEDNEIVAAQKALDGVWGVDINPFAVAIARFRLIVAALQACGIKRLKDAPAWKIHLATGDSLLFGSRWDREGRKKGEQQFFETDEESWAPEIFACEDKQTIQEVLGQQYHAVVGNPPYITVKDKSLNQAYRERYRTCHRQYSLAVPFMERFFDLAVAGGEPRNTRKQEGTSKAGYVGQITANSFMKREFGKKLIEEFLPEVDLSHVIDTSGAYIPGHGTPTVILFGRKQGPQEQTVRAVLGITGEPSTPPNPSQGLVWQSIVKHIDVADAQDAFTSTADIPRVAFTSHPWSIGGGGAADLKDAIESKGSSTLLDKITEIGRSTHTGEDGVFYLEPSAVCTRTLRPFAVPLIEGEGIRDYTIAYTLLSLFPYDLETANPIEITERPWTSHFWRYRTCLRRRKDFGQFIEERGLRWMDHSMFFPSRFRTSLSIAFAFVATHNHFVSDPGGKVFNRSAPIIKLKEGSSEDDHLALLGLLNSSTACFWMKQTFHNKGSTVDQHGARQRTDPFEDFFEFTSTGLQRFPIPDEKPLTLVRQLDQLAQQYALLLPEQLVEQGVPTAAELEQANARATELRCRMIALQEELDWQCYRLYGLTEQMLFETQRHREHGKEERASDSSVPSMPPGFETPSIQLGERSFEFVMARQMAKGELQTTWFERHGSTPITELPVHWPDSYRKLVERRIELIETDKNIGLIERPEYKRRWNTESWEVQQQRALRNWLLDRLESQEYWSDPQQHEPRLRSVAELADSASGDHEFLQVAAIFRGRDDFDVAALVAELVESEAVPFLPILRYKSSGLRKRGVWEKTWELQRKEDEVKAEGGRMKDEKGDIHPSSFIPQPFSIPVPPKYTSADFQSSDYWRLRGKLDVPKERWISLPHCETDNDSSLVVGWAGWNHLQQATAIVAYYDARKREGWDAKRLTPLLAGLDQLLPWIHQWHPEVDPEFGETAGQSFQTMLEADAHELGLTLEDIRAWEPPAKKRAGRKKKG